MGDRRSRGSRRVPRGHGDLLGWAIGALVLLAVLGAAGPATPVTAAAVLPPPDTSAVGATGQRPDPTPVSLPLGRSARGSAGGRSGHERVRARHPRDGARGLPLGGDDRGPHGPVLRADVAARRGDRQGRVRARVGRGGRRRRHHGAPDPRTAAHRDRRERRDPRHRRRGARPRRRLGPRGRPHPVHPVELADLRRGRQRRRARRPGQRLRRRPRDRPVPVLGRRRPHRRPRPPRRRVPLQPLRVLRRDGAGLGRRVRVRGAAGAGLAGGGVGGFGLGGFGLGGFRRRDARCRGPPAGRAAVVGVPGGGRVRSTWARPGCAGVGDREFGSDTPKRCCDTLTRFGISLLALR